MKKVLAIVVLSASLCGCFSTGGTADYVLEPVANEVTGEWVCCRAEVYNSKDYDSLEVVAKKNADGSISVKLSETGVSASDPAAVAAQNNAKLLDVLNKVVTTIPPDT